MTGREKSVAVRLKIVDARKGISFQYAQGQVCRLGLRFIFIDVLYLLYAL
jgi:hypothetical protein